MQNSPSLESLEEEDVLPPNMMDAQVARARINSPTSSERKLLPQLPTPPQLVPFKKPRPLPTSPDDPFAQQMVQLPRPLPPPRTPSPSKAAHPEPGSKSPLKLFQGRYDTFTKETLGRRISQLEGDRPDYESDSKLEPNSDQLYGSNPEISVIEPLGTPLRNQQHSYHIIENSGFSLGRSRQRKDSSSSLPNDGVHGPVSPVKERTPKRLRRSLSGRPKLKEKQVSQTNVAGPVQKIASKETQTQAHHARRVSTPSPRPRHSITSESSDIPILLLPEDSCSFESSLAPPLSRGGLGGALIEDAFRGLGIGLGMDDDERKGSVTTQDFLAQADEVMGRIRATKGVHGKDQSWLSEGTTGPESFLTEAEKSLPAEEVNRIKAKFQANIPAQKKNPSAVENEGPSSQATTSTLVNNPQPQPRVSALRPPTAYSGSEGGTTRRYPNAAQQKNAIEALCAAVVKDKKKAEKRNTTYMTGKRGTAPNGEDPTKPAGTSRATSAESHSSRSDIRHIHPTQVEHLIPERIGAMIFDPVQLAWVRSKTPGRESQSLSESNLRLVSSCGGDEKRPGNNTEEDPFQGISDLSVDVEKEARALMDASRMQEMITELEQYVIEDSGSEAEYTSYTTKKVVRRIDREEIRRDIRQRIGAEKQNMRANMSKPSLIEDSANFPQVEEDYDTTSWMQHAAADITVMPQQTHGSSEESFSPETKGGQGTQSTSWQGKLESCKAKASPTEEAISQLSAMDSHSGENLGRDEDDGRDYGDETEDSPVRQRGTGDQSNDETPPYMSREKAQIQEARENKWRSGIGDTSADESFRSATRAKPGSNPYRNFSARGTPFGRRMSSGGRSFIGRPVSRINEEDEEEAVQARSGGNINDPQSSISSALTPLPPRLPPNSINKPHVSYHLSSPLPELSYQFESTRELLGLELTYIAQRHPGGKRVTPQELEGSFSLAQDDLLRHLTDMEPFEPYWEYMKYLKLNGRKILTLHGLQEWCPRIEELDVTDNEIGQVSGVPNTVRNLKIAMNQLSSLTAWGHLTNLQYIDLSKNNLDSLAGRLWNSRLAREMV